MDRACQGLRLGIPTSWTTACPTGETFAPRRRSKAALKPEHRAVFVQATETSTAVRHDVEAIAKLVKDTDALLVVDGITGLGTTHFDVDGWGIDILIGGSQKAVMIPPGLAYLSVSDKAWATMEQSKNPRYYFDLRKERKNAGQGRERVHARRLPWLQASAPRSITLPGKPAAIWKRAASRWSTMHRSMPRQRGRAFWRWASQLFAPTAPAAAATAVAVPEGMNSGDVVKALKTRFASIIANGQGEMQGKIFRVAHLGFFDYLDTVALLAAMEHIAKDTLKLPVVYGQAVAAAQEVYCGGSF